VPRAARADIGYHRPMPSFRSRRPSAVLLAFLCAGCGGKGADPEASTLELTAYGGAPLEQGLDAAALRDGWAVRFEAFRMQFSDLHIGTASIPDPTRVDLTVPSNGAGLTLAEVEVSPGEYGGAAFVVSEIEALGRATRAGVTKRFAWSFTSPTYYDACTPVTSIPEGADARIQIAVHGENLFQDELSARAPSLSFDHLAASDTDDDGFISRAELELATDLPAQPASGRVDNLWDWLVASSRTLSTLDGGSCRASSY
jgi:hypothetical protein